MPKETEQEMSELIEQWRKENHAHCMEGSSGVRKFEELCKAIGYQDGNFFNDALRNFLSDNSGAIEALITWIGECDDWKEHLQQELQEE